jgi:hypothetical protein
VNRREVLSFVCGAVVVLIGCASTFPYKYYATSMPGGCYDEGTLLGVSGSSGWPDVALDECKPDPAPSPGASTTPVLLKCITMMAPDFYASKAAYLKCQNDLKVCQTGPSPTGGR